jgi:hypothetical protein
MPCKRKGPSYLGQIGLMSSDLHQMTYHTFWRSTPSAIVFAALLSSTFPVVGLGEVERRIFPPGPSKCLSEYMSWKRNSAHWAAFAVNYYNNSGQACGTSVHSPSRKIAESEALSICKRQERMGAGLRASCFVYDLR